MWLEFSLIFHVACKECSSTNFALAWRKKSFSLSSKKWLTFSATSRYRLFAYHSFRQRAISSRHWRPSCRGILPNANSHLLRRLPPWSPMLNIIEEVFSSYKAASYNFHFSFQLTFFCNDLFLRYRAYTYIYVSPVENVTCLRKIWATYFFDVICKIKIRAKLCINLTFLTGSPHSNNLLRISQKT